METTTSVENSVSFNYRKKCRSDVVPHDERNKVLRSLLVLALRVTRKAWQSPFRTLEANSSTGLATIQWLKWLQSDEAFKETSFVLNTPVAELESLIRSNVDSAGVSSNIFVKQTVAEAIVSLLQKETFQFVLLEAKTSLSHFLPAIFAHAPRKSVIALMVSDDVSFVARDSKLIEKFYPGFTNSRVYYAKESSIRVLLAACIRTASSYNRCLEVLLTLPHSCTQFMLLRVSEKHAPDKDAMSEMIRYVIHCSVCQERALLPSTYPFLPLVNPYTCLPCSCNENNPGTTAIIIGPLWTGSLWNTDFLKQLKVEAAGMPADFDKSVEPLLGQLIEESCMGILDRTDSEASNSVPPEKKRKMVDEKNLPLFYCHTPSHCKGTGSLPSINQVVQCLRLKGHLASKTVFDSQSVRTDASLATVTDVILGGKLIGSTTGEVSRQLNK